MHHHLLRRPEYVQDVVRTLTSLRLVQVGTKIMREPFQKTTPRSIRVGMTQDPPEFPDTRGLLPAQARRLVTAYLLRRMKEVRLDWNCHPTYTLADAFEENLKEDPWGRLITTECFMKALEEYEAKHPRKWDPVRKLHFREGIGYGPKGDLK